MSKEPMTFAQAVAKIIKLDMADDPEWRLSHVARLDAAFALREFSKEGNQYGRG